jgi:hypothetical protein
MVALIGLQQLPMFVHFTHLQSYTVLSRQNLVMVILVLITPIIANAWFF